MSRPDATEADPSTFGESVPDSPPELMRRDDEFLLDEDREYVCRDDGRSWRSWVSPVLFGVGLAVLVGDAITVGVGLAFGAPVAHPVTGPVVAAVGLDGLVLLKALVAVLLVLLASVTDDTRQTLRASVAGVVVIGLLVVASNAWAVLTLAG